MMRKVAMFFIVSFMVTIALTGCGDTDPDSMFKNGKYSEAYTEFVKRAGTNDIILKTEIANASDNKTQQRQSAGNQALHDYYYAAECQKRLGNTAEANLYYQRVIDISKYQIRTPHDQGARLKEGFERLWSRIYGYQLNLQVYMSQTPEQREKYLKSSVCYSFEMMLSYQQEMEELLNSTTPDQVSNIQAIRDQYQAFLSDFNAYVRYAGPGNLVWNPESVYANSLIYYPRLESECTRFASTLSNAQTKVTYTVESFNLTEPQLVTQATAALGSSTTSSIQAQASAEPNQTLALDAKFSAAPVTGDIKTAEASMKAAYDNYKNLCNIGADEAEVKKALSAYNEAKAKFNALKKQK